jgi:hypothetical protein
VPDGAFEYIPRKPDETVLYGVIVEQLKRSSRVSRHASVRFRDLWKNVELHISHGLVLIVGVTNAAGSVSLLHGDSCLKSFGFPQIFVLESAGRLAISC